MGMIKAPGGGAGEMYAPPMFDFISCTVLVRLLSVRKVVIVQNAHCATGSTAVANAVAQATGGSASASASASSTSGDQKENHTSQLACVNSRLCTLQTWTFIYIHQSEPIMPRFVLAPSLIAPTSVTSYIPILFGLRAYWFHIQSGQQSLGFYIQPDQHSHTQQFQPHLTYTSSLGRKQQHSSQLTRQAITLEAGVICTVSCNDYAGYFSPSNENCLGVEWVSTACCSIYHTYVQNRPLFTHKCCQLMLHS